MTDSAGASYSCRPLENLTLVQLRELRKRSKAQRTGHALPLVRQEREGILPLSFAQESLWFLEQLELVGTAYSLRVALRLEGKLELNALECSFAELIRRHESLRTRFESQAGSPYQVVAPPWQFELQVYDLSNRQEADKESELDRLINDEAERPFDLSGGRLLRGSLLELAREDHVLILTMHHIVSDGWSLGILCREIGALYTAYVRGESSQLPELPVQYPDYAIWQRRWLHTDVLDQRLQFWREQLRGAPPQLELPTDRPRPAVESFRGARLAFELPESLSVALKELGRCEGATLFMVLLAAYQVLLSRWSGQQDVVVGSPVAGRTKSEIEGLIGFFVNTLVLRTNVSDDPTFRQLVDRVKEVTLAAYAHQDLPFEVVVKELRPDRDLARQPLVQVMLALQNYPEERLELPALTLSRISTKGVTTHFDLTLYLYEEPGGISGVFEYATDLFYPETIERIARHFRTLLEGAAVDPDRPIHQLPLLSKADKQQLTVEWNDTATSCPQHKLIHELFEEQVRCKPAALAVVCEEQRLTYADLNRKANQLAHYLRMQGVQVGEYIPILMPRSPQMVVAQLAILKIGGVYVPLDSSLPHARLAFIIRDCCARRILADRKVHAELEQQGLQWINCLELAGVLEESPADNLNVQIRESLPAYVMYTSGSTGIPKGVIVLHRAVNRLAVNNGYASIESTDCIAHCSNPAFDASTFEIWGALLNGASLLITPQNVVLEAKLLQDMLRQYGVSVLFQTTALFNERARTSPEIFEGLRYLLFGGEIADPSAARRVIQERSPQHLLHVYGPTETTTFATWHPTLILEDDASSLPIGRPIANTQAYILDSHLQLVPIGVTGEIYIGGIGVALGYLNRPELTAERFISDPFSEDAGARLYKTGDLGRWRVEGNIEFLGRNDQQVKLRGFRIELGEIEAQLVRYEKVKDAVVIAREDVPGERRLVAYITQSDRSPLRIDDLREHLKAALPEYMLPSAFVVLENVPLTANGKVNRNALPAPAIDLYASDSYEAPRGEVEIVLAKIWEELLGVERVGRKDNFFSRGGHSLLVLKALFKIHQSLECTLKVSDVYMSPTLEELATRICGYTQADSVVDLSREAALGHEIVAKSEPHHGHANSILLTGATGFVGRFLLVQLLEDTHATIYCLVRESSQCDAFARLRDVLVKWDLWHDELDRRVVAVPGDLRMPRLGLDEVTYWTLSKDVGTIYHCGTSMNHLETYAMAKAANVDSARELLKFATTRRSKLINYISTLSVFKRSDVGAARVVTEESPIDDEKHSASSGYVASKWVGEKIFMSASERSIPCNIFRLGLVWADTQQGRYDELQREYRILKSSLISGYGIKEYRYGMAPTPVDYVARAVVFLSKQHHEGKGVFHISSSKQAIHSVFERCNEIANTSLDLLPLYDWIGQIKRLHYDGRSLPVVPLVEFAFSMDEASFHEHQRLIRSASIQFDSSRTNQELEASGIVAPVLGDDLLKVCLKSLFSRDAECRHLRTARTSLAAVAI